MDALKWLLCRNPKPNGSLGRVESGIEWRAYVQSGDPLAGTPDIWITYTYTDEEILVRGVHAILRDDEDDL